MAVARHVAVDGAVARTHCMLGDQCVYTSLRLNGRGAAVDAGVARAHGTLRRSTSFAWVELNWIGQAPAIMLLFGAKKMSGKVLRQRRLLRE